MEYLGYENDFTKQEIINQKCQEAEKNGWKEKEEKEDANTYVYTCEQGDWYYKTDCSDQDMEEESKTLRVYISGAISGTNLEYTRSEFREAEEWLSDNGYEPVNPFKNGVPVNASIQEHMRADYKMLLSCDGIMMLSGWYKSKNCKSEFDVATTCGMFVVDLEF